MINNHSKRVLLHICIDHESRVINIGILWLLWNRLIYNCASNYLLFFLSGVLTKSWVLLALELVFSNVKIIQTLLTCASRQEWDIVRRVRLEVIHESKRKTTDTNQKANIVYLSRSTLESNLISTIIWCYILIMKISLDLNSNIANSRFRYMTRFKWYFIHHVKDQSQPHMALSSCQLTESMNNQWCDYRCCRIFSL